MSNLKPSTRRLISEARYNKTVAKKYPREYRPSLAKTYKKIRASGGGASLRKRLISFGN